MLFHFLVDVYLLIASCIILQMINTVYNFVFGYLIIFLFLSIFHVYFI